MMKKVLVIICTIAVLLVSLCLTAFAGDNGRTELTNMRGEFTKVYKNNDGTISRQYWLNPIHYLDENNQWEEIDRTIVDFAKEPKTKARFDKDFSTLMQDVAKEEGAKAEDFNKGVTKHLYKMYFPKQLKHSIQFQYEKYLFSMKPLNTQQVHKQKDKTKDQTPNEITYSDVWYHTDLKYEMNFNGISEYIILNDISAAQTFSFAVKTKGLDLKTTDSREIGAYDRKDGKLIFTIPRPVMWDANNVYCKDVKYELKRDQQGYILTLHYNQDYLHTSDRAFPVTIDPDIVLARNYVDEMTYVDTNEPDTNFYSSARMEVGNYKDWNFLWLGYNWELRRGIFRFNRLTSDLGSVSDQVQVKQAKLYLDCSENKTESTYVDIYHVFYDAADWEVTKVTWNQPWGSGGFNVTPANEDTWIYVPKGESYPRTYVCYLPTDVVSTWIHSKETMNKGLMLFDYYQGNGQDTLKKFNNAALEITLNEEIFIEASASVYPYTPQTIRFNATASSATCGSISRYEWDFDINDGINNRDTRQNPVYCYQTPGDHTYSVKAIDANGHSRTYYGTVRVNPVTIEAYYGVSDPKTLRFVTNTNYSNTYTWDFGDNSTNYIGVEGYHRYNGEGTYNVKLTITNNYGVNPLTVTKKLHYYHPVVLVHGHNDDVYRFQVLYDYLRNIVYSGDMNIKICSSGDNIGGQPVHTVFNVDYYKTYTSDEQFQNVGAIGTDGTTVRSTDSGNGSYGDQYNSLTFTFADQLRQTVENICTTTGFDKVDLVAHSMGGLVCRAYTKYEGGNLRVDRVLTLGTPNHGVGDLQKVVADLTPEAPWMRELEDREMAYNSNTFYNTSNPSQLKSYIELLNNDIDVSISGHTLTGCGSNDTVGPTRYATIAGTDNGHVAVPVLDLVWEWLAPDDGIVDVGSVRLNGSTVDTNLLYPGMHAMAVPGNKSSLQSVVESPFIATFINTWMRQDRTLDAVQTKPAAWVDVEKYADGTVKRFIVHTGATRQNAIFTWAMLQHEEEVQTENGTEFWFTFKDYNSFWKDLSNATTDAEVLIDLAPAHYLPGENVRVTVVTYDTQGVKVEYIPVQL